MDETIKGFSDEEQKILSEIITAINELSSRTPIVGFHHLFYIPGWIGAIQEIFVEYKMEKEAEKKFYNNMNYYEFVDWILTITKQISELHYATKPTNINENIDEMQTYREQSDYIIKLIRGLIESWAHCYPEIAKFVNLRTNEDMMISRVGLLYQCTKETLKPINDTDFEIGFMDSSFKDDLKSLFFNILSMLCNVIVFAIIVYIISLIF